MEKEEGRRKKVRSKKEEGIRLKTDITITELKRLVLLLVSSFFLVPFSIADDMGVVRSALRDGLWETARHHAKDAASAGNAEARLAILESFASEDRWDDVKATLAGWADSKDSRFDYYRAVVDGDHAAAAKILADSGTSDGLIAASLYEADALAKSGDRAGAEAIWRKVASSTNASERALATAGANLMEEGSLRNAYDKVRSAPLKRMLGLRLGQAMLGNGETAQEGERIVRSIARDAPDADGAREAFLAVADAKMSAGLWTKAAETLREAIEIWPDLAKSGAVQEQRGWVLHKLGRNEESLEAFRMAAELAANEDARATAITKEGDVLASIGRDEEATARYREVIGAHPQTDVAALLARLVKIRELEAKGRALYREYRFDAARKTFAEVAAADPERKPRMDFFSVLCLYGEGLDEEAGRKAGEIVRDCPDRQIRAEAMMWLAKLRFNRREWKEASSLFQACAKESGDDGDKAAEALIWAARAAFAGSDFQTAVQLSTKAAERRPGGSILAQALLVQGEALMEMARFDEAVLVLDQASAAEGVPEDARTKAQTLRADAFYAMGADNPARYSAALDAYRATLFGGILSPSARIVTSFKIARALEKLKRMDEAIDQYYTQVVLAYLEGRTAKTRFDDDARAAFSKAAFRLADEFESRGRDRAATGILELVVNSGVHAADEARRRIERLASKGMFN